MEAMAANIWRKCSSCKKGIELGAKYYVCSVSTCNSIRTNYVFCSVHCFERHLPGARHKDAAAIEKMAPMTPAAEPSVAAASVAGAVAVAAAATAAAKPAGQRVFATSSSTAPVRLAASANVPKEVLVIASRLKDYIQARGDYNTSASVMDVLSDHLRVICDRGIDNARADGRKTVMDRDFEFLKK